MFDRFAADVSTRLSAVCPQEIPGAKTYTDQLTGHLMWVVIIGAPIVALVAILAIGGGRVLGIPMMTKGGVITLCVILIVVILYFVMPPMIDSFFGDGCVG